ncbi:MAG: hypothetical protein A2514_10320 [Gammaproteobacteria bacterium RIFOXYD12_FULL_61_37]|nr:MAG: hypothetical protein A2514_10320 [Gammaproteobacteria bacterium RIFOXYD12_FULL_61_37]
MARKTQGPQKKGYRSKAAEGVQITALKRVIRLDEPVANATDSPICSAFGTTRLSSFRLLHSIQCGRYRFQRDPCSFQFAALFAYFQPKSSGVLCNKKRHQKPL